MQKCLRTVADGLRQSPTLAHRAERLTRVSARSLQRVKAIKAAAGDGTTVNDVVYAAFAGALRRHCASHGAELDDEGGRCGPCGAPAVRALVPYAFGRSPDAPSTNDWTFLSVAMPAEVTERRARLGAAHAQFDALKRSPEALAARLAVQINAASPPRLLGAVAQQLFSRHSLVFSNVPGPDTPICVGGKRVLAIYSAFPNLIMQARRAPEAINARVSPRHARTCRGMLERAEHARTCLSHDARIDARTRRARRLPSQVLCLSYDGTMYMSIACDDDVPHPEGLADLYIDELRCPCTCCRRHPHPPLRLTHSAHHALCSHSQSACRRAWSSR